MAKAYSEAFVDQIQALAQDQINKYTVGPGRDQRQDRRPAGPGGVVQLRPTRCSSPDHTR